jgi:hypothetical protein
LDPKQVPVPSGTQQRLRKSSAAGWIGAVVIAAVGLGAGLTYLLPSDSSDHLTNNEIQQRQLAFAAHGPMQVEPVPADQVRDEIAKMQLSPSESAALLASADSSNASVRLARVKVWDNQAQDGDVVEIASGGYRLSVQLLNAPVQLTVPVDATNAFQITGVRDGGGGITLGVQGNAGGIALPVLAPGQVLSVPVSF